MQDLRTEALPSRGTRTSQAEYGSDLVVEMFANLGIPYVALNPGSSYRGIHDSLVNFQVPGKPEMVLCCHEEIAVAVAHGYARVTGKPMLAAVHDVVGLQHASMAIYNAWCDRVPMIVIGGTGPAATSNRRNHIDWVHTANVQGNLVRDFVKWDDQPANVAAIPESIMRGYRITVTEPSGPIYLCYDVDVQEEAIPSPIALPDLARFRPPAPVAADPDSLQEAATLLAGATWPVILADGVGRHRDALPALQELAELLAAPVVSTARYNIPTNHPLNVSRLRRDVLAQADVLLALDVFDLSGPLGPATSPEREEGEFIPPNAKIIHISVWDLLQHSLTSDYERLHPVDVPISADTRTALPALIELCRREIERDSSSRGRIDDRSKAIQRLQGAARERQQRATQRNGDGGAIAMDRVMAELNAVVKAGNVPWTVVGGARGGGFEFSDPVQVASGGRGGGLGEAAGASVGAALAHRGDGRLCISTIGDGNLLYTPSALWTASNLHLPLLTIVNNNRSYGNDEGHQEYLAQQRGRPVENKGVGIYIESPITSFTHLAQAFDVEGIGPIEDPSGLRPALERAVKAAMEQRPVLVDVRTARGRGDRD